MGSCIHGQSLVFWNSIHQEVDNSHLHFLSSNNPLRNSTNNKIPFFPFIFQKDFFGFILILCLYLLQTHFGISSFSHPDNALEVCGLLTPLHIVPEWYFLSISKSFLSRGIIFLGFIFIIINLLSRGIIFSIDKKLKRNSTKE